MLYLPCKFQDFLREIRVIRVFKVSMCWLALFLFLSVSTRDKRDEINIFVAGDPCRKEHPMLKVFATQVVVSRGYDGAAAIKFSEKGDAVRFRIGKKVYDPNAENNARWINLAV